MGVTLDDMKTGREWGIRVHQAWKRQLIINDAIAADKWDVVWDDDVVDDSGPLVENVYKGAFEDKVATSTVGPPTIFVPAPLGTAADRGEKRAQKRQRVYQSYWDRSRMETQRTKLFGDWLHAGAWYLLPWTDWVDVDGNIVPPAARAPRMLKMDPRQAYPLAHDSLDQLSSVMFIRRRRFVELQKEYGVKHPTLAGFARSRSMKGLDESVFVEEVWFFDNTDWAVAIADSTLPAFAQGREFYSRGEWDDYQGGAVIDWLSEPVKHRLERCPVIEKKRMTHDNAYRGALEDIIPQLRLAQNLTARLLEDLNANIYAPVLLDNVENPEDYGPGATLIGTGDGKATITRDRPPVNFEGQRTVQDLIEGARKQGTWPVQRSGDPDASIVSSRGVVALAGSFNAELALMQADMADGLTQANKVTAAFDEHHCPGKKTIDGIEGVTGWGLTYDPTVLFDGDYRNRVAYGDKAGMDTQAYLTNLAMLYNLGRISGRTFMFKSGMVDDPIAEETDIALEDLNKTFFVSLNEQASQGNLGPLKAYAEKIDTDKMTPRAAMLETIKEMEAVPAEPPGGGPGGPGGGPPDIQKMMASLQSGGIPGGAEGLPAPPSIGPELAAALPQGPPV